MIRRMARALILLATILPATVPLANAAADAPVIAAPAPAPPARMENSKPQPLPFEETIPRARDTPFPGKIALEVDATDTRRGIFSVKEVITGAPAGPMVLLFPKWLPGNHSPTGQIDKLTGLIIAADGEPVAWRRDPVEVFAFHLDVPRGAERLEIAFQFLSSTSKDTGPIVMSANILRLQWNSVSLYPAGYFVRNIPVSARVTYPADFDAVSALDSTCAGTTCTYEATNYEILVDSPVLAGRFHRRWALSPRVDLDAFADDPADLFAGMEQIAAHRELIDQTLRMFGAAQHYDHYRFLLSISDQLTGIGLEHHRSSEDGVPPGYFQNWKDGPASRNLLPHEFTHSWNGKFRRGAGLWTPDYNTPTRAESLWVYEGLTHFLGYVLPVRAGLITKQDTLDQYAIILAALDTRPGRAWRSLIDTTNDPVMSMRRPRAWPSWQRNEDYYLEGLLIWMRIDSILRAKSGGRRSIDDFTRAFFAGRDGDYGEITYDRDDIIQSLEEIQPYDWRGLLGELLDGHNPDAPVEGFVANGYSLLYSEEPTKAFAQYQKTRGVVDLNASLGLVIDRDARITYVGWNSPAFTAGLANGDTITGVGIAGFSETAIRAAITAAKTSPATQIALTIRHGAFSGKVAIDYHGGLRYPRLEKTGTGEGGLDRLLQPR
jgi:predicted metalloprotease with PDZ domain